MPVTQANRMDEIEVMVAALQGEVPELRESMEEKFRELKKCFEDAQARGEAEQNKKLEENAKEKKISWRS